MKNRFVLKYQTFLFLLIVFMQTGSFSQTPENEVGQMRLGRLWGGVIAHGDQVTLDFTAGFFPNDYDIIQYRGQYNDNFFGSGFKLACTKWITPVRVDSVLNVAIFGPKNDYYPNGKVTVPLTNYVRYKYPLFTISNKKINLTDFGTYDPSKFGNNTCDQIVEVTYKNVLGVEVKRKVMSWGQNFNDSYVIIDVEFSNVGYYSKTMSGQDTLILDTLRNFYINMQQSMGNNFYSNGSNPAPSQSEQRTPTHVWQHYYGGKIGDSLRLFYFYHADDPTTSGDNMGNPVVTQRGRLINTNFTYYTILHASAQPYVNPVDDVDDFLQPRVTYIGTDTKIPDPGSGEDPYGSKNYWAIRGGYSQKYPMPNSIPGTYHGINNDDLGTADFSNFPAGTVANANSRNFASFGPYTFLPGQKIHVVYAVGTTGIGIEKSQEIGEKWLNGTLTDPPNMPNPNTGWLPSNFQFPSGATEMDKRKDRWISMGMDSMFLSAWRAKWNFTHNYQIPKTPPPPEEISITGYGDGVEIKWKGTQAELLPEFAGYRILRKASTVDTVFYEEIYSSDENDKAVEHFFKDKTMLFGGQYYYYIQTKARISMNDLNADPTTRGKIMLSSRNLVPTLKENFINPPRLSQDDMSKIRIAPNPYNINDPLLNSYGWNDNRGIIFFNLPATVTIKIFTENGDLIKTIENNTPERTGSVTWNMITTSQQVISSGVYIAVFEKPTGEISYQKFVVVR